MVVDDSDARGREVVDAVDAAVAELELQSVVFGVWVGDDELARGAVDAPSGMAPTSRDAVVRVGQPMESMLTTILLQLDDEGVLGLDDPVDEYVPELPNGELITPRMLANSTSGTPDYIPNPNFEATLEANPFAQWTYRELLDFATEAEPLFAPGESWSYSHTDIATLGTVIEETTGEELPDLFAERIFAPVGMDDSVVVTTNVLADPAFHAYTSERGFYEDSTYWNPTWALNSGNMNATVADIGRWARALGRGDLLDEEAHEEQLGPATVGLGPLTEERYFAFGIGVVGDWLVANPSLQGYSGLMAYLDDPEVTIVVYTTGTPENAQEQNDAVELGERLAEILVPDNPLNLS